MPEARGHRGPPWGQGWGPGGRHGPGRHMFRRIGGFLLFLVIIGVVIGATVATGVASLRGGERWLVIGLTVVVLLLFALVARRLFGRTLGPVGELIDATQRLGDGDTSVRVRIRRPGPFAAVLASFNRMADHLEREDERRRRLLADIGHELRTPMTVIRGEIEAVIDGLHQPERLSNVVDEVDLMERLLDDLKVLALAEAGKLQLVLEPTDLGDLAGEVVASFATSVETASIKASVRSDPAAPEIEIDPHRMHQVLSNLVSNAINQMPDGGKLDISVSTTANAVVVMVSDDGPGIAPADRERIFERFVRSGDAGGTGLGLSISRDLVAAHGGTLEVDDTYRSGARFVITLPT